MREMARANVNLNCPHRDVARAVIGLGQGVGDIAVVRPGNPGDGSPGANQIADLTGRHVWQVVDAHAGQISEPIHIVRKHARIRNQGR